jgi:hypothetical protein|tara:strand:+ start:214 stop:525 length:312 start_codon:yes stop_codon:yes gene_type:complete
MLNTDTKKRIDTLEQNVEQILTLLTGEEEQKEANNHSSLRDETDPMTRKIEELELDAISKMPTGSAIVRGRYGTTRVNYSKEKLETIENWKKNRRMRGIVTKF